MNVNLSRVMAKHLLGIETECNKVARASFKLGIAMHVAYQNVIRQNGNLQLQKTLHYAHAYNIARVGIISRRDVLQRRKENLEASKRVKTNIEELKVSSANIFMVRV